MKRKSKCISAKRRLVCIAMILLIPFLLFMIASIMYTGYVYRRELIQNGKSRVLNYLSEEERSLKNVDEYLMNRVANDMEFSCLFFPINDVDSYLHIYNLKEKLFSIIKITDCVDALYVFAINTDMCGVCYGDNMNLQEKDDLKMYLKNLLVSRPDTRVSKWEIHNVNGENYFLKIMGGNGAYCVCAVNVNTVSVNRGTEEGNGFIVFAEDNTFLAYRDELEELGIELQPDKESYVSGWKNEWIVTSGYSEYLGCHIFLIEVYRDIWEAESAPFILIAVFGIFSGLMMYCYKILKRDFLFPVEHMVLTMDEISKEEFDFRLKVDSIITEYQKMEDNFNHMIQKISELKVIAYNRLIQVQQVQLQYYQIQIRPHFFLNCMKNLYAIAAIGKYEKLQDMIFVLSDYLRSVLGEQAETIPLRKEMEKVFSYVKLQQMGSSINIDLETDIEADVQDFLIPPMSILTFVENSFRYIMNKEDIFHIYIKAGRLVDGNDEFVNITIKDSGCGFEEEVLEILNDPKRQLSSEHLGIYNVERRFDLIYGSNCNFVFYNMDGACIDIFIKWNKPEKREEEKNDLG